MHRTFLKILCIFFLLIFIVININCGESNKSTYNNYSHNTRTPRYYTGTIEDTYTHEGISDVGVFIYNDIYYKNVFDSGAYYGITDAYGRFYFNEYDTALYRVNETDTLMFLIKLIKEEYDTKLIYHTDSGSYGANIDFGTIQVDRTLGVYYGEVTDTYTRLGIPNVDIRIYQDYNNVGSYDKGGFYGFTDTQGIFNFSEPDTSVYRENYEEGIPFKIEFRKEGYYYKEVFQTIKINFGIKIDFNEIRMDKILD